MWYSRDNSWRPCRGLYEAARPSDLKEASSPAAVLRRDRTTFMTSLGVAFFLAVTVGIGAWFSPRDPENGQYFDLTYGIGLGVACFVSVGISLAFCQALWGRLFVARVWYALGGKLPFDIMAFLKDAHINRGVLRQAGAVYQFRHSQLQRRLADVADRQGRPTK